MKFEESGIQNVKNEIKEFSPMMVVIIYSRDGPVRSAVHCQLHDAKMKSSVRHAKGLG